MSTRTAGPFTEIRADVDLAEPTGADYRTDVHVAGFDRGGVFIHSDSVMFGVAVFDPETGSREAFDLLEDGYRDAVESVVSPDGRTLFAVVLVDAGDDEVLQLLAVDLGTGEVTATG
jgi:hypothetical protein